MYDDYSLTGWILALEKQPDGGVEAAYYTYVNQGSGHQGEKFPDY